MHLTTSRNWPQCDAREFPAQSMMEEDQKITLLRLKAQKTSFLDYRVATSPMYLLLSTYTYSKALSSTASSCTDLEDARF